MSALDDAYAAAAEALGPHADQNHDYAAAVAAVYAFLSHLADNPPDEMVTTAMGWLDEVAADADAGTLDRRDCQKDAVDLLSAALRSIGADK